MRFRAGVLALGVCVTALSGCGSKEDASKANFGAAISRYLAGDRETCLGFRVWPVDVRLDVDEALMVAIGSNIAQRMRALEGVGLVEGHPVSGEESAATGVRYDLTKKGRGYYRRAGGAEPSAGEGIGDYKDLCFGRLVLDAVVKWEAFQTPGEAAQARVFYTYKIDDLADWTKDKLVREAFGEAAWLVDGNRRERKNKILTLSSEGWDVTGED